METMAEIMLQQELNDLRRSLSMFKNQLRNVISDLEENEDPQEAIVALKSLIGDE